MYEKDKKGLRDLLPPLSFRARTFVALVGISAFTSLGIGLVLFYFAGDQLAAAEEELMEQRSNTAHEGAEDFLSGLRNPEDDTFPEPDSYAEELVRSIDRTGLSALYVSPSGEPLVARDGEESSLEAERAYDNFGLDEEAIQSAIQKGEEGEGGNLIARDNSPRYVAVLPLTSSDGTVRGVMAYTNPQAGFDQALTFLRYGILGAIGASVALAGVASIVLARQITRPLSETRDALIRVSAGDYRAVPVNSRDELGELVEAFNNMADEIERYITEIQEQKSRLEAVLEASPEAVVAVDPAERVTMSNPAAARMLGVRMSDAGRRIEDLGTPEEVLKCLREAASTGTAVREVEFGGKTFWSYAAQMSPEADRLEYPSQNVRNIQNEQNEHNEHNEYNGQSGQQPGTELSPAADGPSTEHHASGSLPEQRGQEPAGTILAVRDITEHRSLEKAKTAFVSDVSHELRTPLTTIQSAVDLVGRAREKLDPIEHRALELAEGELNRVRDMVEELLTLAQMDSWQYALEMKPNDVDEVVQSAVESVESKANRFGIAIHFRDNESGGSSDSGDSETVQGNQEHQDRQEHHCICDSGRLYQVFLNLLDNAIKYSDPGAQVYVSLREEGSSVVVSIRDTGVGIPEEDLPQLFERFYRVDKARSRATGGSGLGLSITREIVELHGGEVSVKSEVGVGSTFEVSLPKAPLPRSANYAI